jgi:hypothetical protein
MARYRVKSHKAEASIMLRGEDWSATGVVTFGSEPYFSSSYGNYLPGDDDVVEDVELKPDGHTNGTLDFDALTRDEQMRVEEELLNSAAEDSASRAMDAAEARADSDRDDRRLGQGRYER